MKAKVNITVDPNLWQEFRVECVKRQVSASSEVEALVSIRLDEWKKEKKGGKRKE